MTNVISLRRTKDDLKEKVIEQIKDNTNTSQFFISYPENDEGKIFFYTNFSPGAAEIYALEALLDYMRDNAYEVVEEDS